MKSQALLRPGTTCLTRAATLLWAMAAGCIAEPTTDSHSGAAVEPVRVRLGQFNIREMTTAKLLNEDDRQVRAAAEILSRFAPDILSINELQFDLEGVPEAGLPGAPAGTLPGSACEGKNARRLADRLEALHPELRYPYTVVALGNSGLPFEATGELPPELLQRGFGEFPGRFNVALVSRFPILHDQVRVIHDFPWRQLPGNRLAQVEEETGIVVPDDFPLFEKALVIVPVDVDGVTLHVILVHPVSSGFNDMNPHRNHDELRGVSLFLDGALPGVEPLPAGARFVIVGDLNADPEDGEGIAGAVAQLYEHPLVVAHFASGEGGTAGMHPERNSFLSGCGKGDGTIVQNPASRLQLQLDYVLPSVTIGAPVASGLFFPSHVESWDDYVLACTASDHRFVWADVDLK
ncbi:MAG: endonuclease/exonuclease/phosphatase family protein [Deltaproteobacteria bacterium]|nr:endonuclease/exonuclease/phosphatase family protein [Deltaproteobacteria bacterium]